MKYEQKFEAAGIRQKLTSSLKENLGNSTKEEYMVESLTALSDFRFSQWSGSNMFYGTPTGWSGHDLYGDVSIPSNQPPGDYDLEVWDYGSNQWIMQEDAFDDRYFS